VEIATVKLEARHIENLKILEAGLRGLPEEYDKFGMKTFFTVNRFRDVPYTENKFEEKMKHCGTAACGIGHAPLFGIKPVGEIPKDELGVVQWHIYSKDVFGLFTHEANTPFDIARAWEFLFGATWRNYDNTPIGLANRIRFFLHNDCGFPVASEEEKKVDWFFIYKQDYSKLELETVS
jgi:hypothetical protein